MSMSAYWRERTLCRDSIGAVVHLVVEHPKYTFPGGVLACSIFPFVAQEVTGARIQRNFKTPTCERCLQLIEWLKLHVVIQELAEKCKQNGVKFSAFYPANAKFGELL